jgi:hypothetical protein
LLKHFFTLHLIVALDVKDAFGDIRSDRKKKDGVARLERQEAVGIDIRPRVASLFNYCPTRN